MDGVQLFLGIILGAVGLYCFAQVWGIWETDRALERELAQRSQAAENAELDLHIELTALADQAEHLAQSIPVGKWS